MPPLPVPGAPSGGGEGDCSDASSEEFAVGELHSLLGSSMPDHHLCVVGSLGALPSSLPRSLAAWPPLADTYRAQPYDDPDTGNHFTFRPWGDMRDEETGEAEGDEEAGAEATREAGAEASQQQAGTDAHPAGALEGPPAALPGCTVDLAPAEPCRQPSEAAK